MSLYGGNDDDATIHATVMVENAVELVRMQLPSGKSRTFCAECNDVIPEQRRNALPGVRFCVDCAEIQDKIKTNIRVVDYIL